MERKVNILVDIDNFNEAENNFILVKNNRKLKMVDIKELLSEYSKSLDEAVKLVNEQEIKVNANIEENNNLVEALKKQHNLLVEQIARNQLYIDVLLGEIDNAEDTNLFEEYVKKLGGRL